jgi:hypothetical protein
MTNQTTVLDPWATAWNPPEQASEWFGQVTVNPWFCSLVKGVGKSPYDPNQLDPNTGNPVRRYTAIDLSLNAITDQQIDPITRTCIAEFGEWPDVILPSMKALGINTLQELNNAWVKCEMVDTGRTYQNQNNETKHATTFKFTGIYADEATCRMAKGGNGSGPTPAGASATPQPPAGNGNKELETAKKFLKPYVQNAWKKANGDVDQTRTILAPMIAQQPLLAKYFTVDSAEVLELITDQIPF